MLFVLLSPRSGLVNNLIGLAGGTPINFMNEEGWFRPIYVLSDIWQNAGFSMIIYLAALAAIDPSLHEAARVDGAAGDRPLGIAREPGRIVRRAYHRQPQAHIEGQPQAPAQ